MDNKIVAMLPIPSLLRIIAKLIRYAKGGIDKQEAADLLEDLLLIAGHLAEAQK